MKVTISFEIDEKEFDEKAIEVDKKSGANAGVDDCFIDFIESFFKTCKISNFEMKTN